MGRGTGAVAAGAAGFRFQPPLVAGERVVARPRLMHLLRHRFERRLTVVSAVAGYGKTTALALAMDANVMQPGGTDRFLGADEFDTDPARFLSGLAALFGVPSTRSIADGVESIATEIWARAPEDVAIIVDDVHLLAGSDSAQILAALLRRLPANGHLVLAGRHVPELPLARLRAHGQLLELGPDELEFDERELVALTTARPGCDVDAATLPRLPALADLRISAGPSAGADFLWEEILSGLDPERVDVLVRVSILDELHDDIVRALSDGRFATDELLRGLPLVDTGRSGRWRMHALMRAALAARLSSTARVEAAERAAEIEAARGDFRVAVQLLAEAGVRDRAIAMARRYVLMPTLRRTFADQTAVRDIVERIEPGSTLARLLRLECRWGEFSTSTDHRALTDELAALADSAQREGDAEIEATARFRTIQGSFLETARADSRHLCRLAELAATVPYAAQVVRFARAEQAMHEGRGDESLTLLTPLDGADREIETVMRAGLLCALARPEQATDLAPTDLVALPEGAELYTGLAIWMRGELAPEEALPLARSICAATVARRVVHPSVSALGTTALIALACGDTATASENVATAQRLAEWGCAPQIGVQTVIAEAALTCVEAGDDASAVVLGRAFELAPLGAWPPRPYLVALPLVYVVRPDTRALLDRCALGPSLSVARDAARALVALREECDSQPALRLPWQRERLLRAHVLPPHLCELAVAAAGAGNEAAADVLARIPGARRHLRALAANGSATAERFLAALPAIPDWRLGVGVLGPMRLARDGVALADPEWGRRARVRELLALLVEERRVPRSRAAAELWPDLDPDKAAANLRVTLTYLQRALEPDRDRYAPPFFVRAADTALVLADEVDVDADEFEAGILRGLEHERSGALRAALESYESALALYRGDYLDDFDVDWAEPTRTRVRFLAVSAMCRVGELVLARGEPERAGGWALRARSLAPLNERAARLYVSCLLGAGDRAGAVAALRELIDDLAAEGLEPEADTATLGERIGALTRS